MPELLIGKVGARKFHLPLDIAQWAMAIHGVRGKGKTNTGVVIVEEALDRGVQVVIIDPTAVWWGLKSTRDGKRAGYPVVILGGEHGDLPLAEGSGAAVADFAVENRVPMILSLRHLRKGAAQRFVQEFAEQLYHRKGESAHRRPLLLVIDEASRFIPQRVQAEQARLVGAIEDIVRQGRASGFGVVLIDQRPASVNKDVLTQIELLVCHAVTSPQDRKALDEWIQGKDSAGHRAKFLEHLASLGRGEAWFWLPMSDLFERVQVRERRTFDSSRTPEIGESMAGPERFAQVDLGALQAQLEHAVEQALANDPKTLKARIRQLEGELELAVDSMVDAGRSDEEVQQLLERQAVELSKRAEAMVKHAVDSLRGEALPHMDALRSLLANGWEPPAAPYPSFKNIPPVPPDYGERVRPEPPKPAPSPRSRRATPARAPTGAAGELGGPHRRILAALAWLEAIGVRPALNEAVAFVAGYRPGGGAFNNPKGTLRTAGLIDYPSAGLIGLTDEGRAAAETPDVPRTLAGLHQMVLSKLAGPERKILEPLLASYPDPMEMADLADASGYSAGGGAFNNPRGRLRTLGLIDYPRQGYAVACDILFPRGVR